MLDREQNRPPAIQEEAVTNLLCHLDTHKSMGSDRIHPRVLLSELMKQLTKPLSIIYHQSLWMGEVSDGGMSPFLQNAVSFAWLMKVLLLGTKYSGPCEKYFLWNINPWKIQVYVHHNPLYLQKCNQQCISPHTCERSSKKQFSVAVFFFLKLSL